MKRIATSTADELLIVTRSPLPAWVGGLGLLLFLWLGYLSLSGEPACSEPCIGLAGSGATCVLFFLAGYENSHFRFDRQSRMLAWSRQHGLFKRHGAVAFGDIDGVALQSCIGNDRYYPKHRVVLLTRQGELPVNVAYEYDAMNEMIAQNIRSFLGMTAGDLIEDSVAALVDSGRKVDAIRLLREKRGLSLSEAHTAIAQLRAGNLPRPERRHETRQ